MPFSLVLYIVEGVGDFSIATDRTAAARQSTSIILSACAKEPSGQC